MSAPALPDGPYLVVSPHFDDAVLSAFALITRPGTTVLTVCTAAPGDPTVTPWDRACGFTDSHEAMRARNAEDEKALEPLGVRRLSCALREKQYRGGAPLDDDREAFLRVVRTWIAAHDGGVIVAPAGAGGPLRLRHRVRHKLAHPVLGLPGGAPPSPEHLWVTDTLAAELGATAANTTLLLYDELPYAWVRSGAARADVVALQLGRRVEVFSMRVDIEEKAAAVACYRSQLALLFASWFRPDRHLPAAERYWLLRGAPQRHRLTAPLPSVLKDSRTRVEEPSGYLVSP